MLPLRTKKQVFTMRFPAGTRRWLDNCAQRHGLAVADVIRALVNYETILALDDKLIAEEMCDGTVSQD